jgi:oligoendopeptidase F
VFRQTVLTRFEEAAFRRRAAGRLTVEALGQDWLGVNRRYYADAVDLPEDYRWGWSYIPHFIHSRFYCYSYVFGQLLVLALYRTYKEEGKSFVPKYLTLLEAGGSDTPEALLKPLGVNIHEAEFWQKGFEETKELIGKLQRLI